jgi:hypothetical protein
MGEIVIRWRIVLNAFEKLKTAGFTDKQSGGGFLTPFWVMGEYYMHAYGK